jgi:hypothetical protein
MAPTRNRMRGPLARATGESVSTGFGLLFPAGIAHVHRLALCSIRTANGVIRRTSGSGMVLPLLYRLFNDDER